VYAHPRRHKLPSCNERGLALISVLWLTSLLILLATAATALTRAHDRMAARAGQTIAAEAIADSAVRLTLLRLSAPGVEEQLPGFSMQSRLQLFGQEIAIRVEREAGRVDLNAAEAPLIAAVLVASGLDSQTSRSFASRIVDWRDGDDRPEAGGAVAEQYRSANVGYEPRNAPFESIEELRQVLGSADVSARALDAFTVFSTQSPTIAPEFAHPLVHRALTIRANESTERSPQDLERAEPPPVPPSVPLGSSGPLTRQVVRIHACPAQLPVALCRTAIARLTGNSQRPFLIYAWYTEDH